jgi:uncharacterized protein (DUF433 family)
MDANEDPLSNGRRFKMNERISIHPDICHGQACVKGTRVPVHQVIRMLANGDTIEEIVEDFPPITQADILACLDYAASLAEEQFFTFDTNEELA